MDLKSGYPFWAVKNGLMHAFPALDADVRCDVVILGAGITGALVARELAQHGHRVCVLDKRDVAWGSTSASTALLQYEIDTPMTELAKKFGESDALLAYLACLQSIPVLAEIAADARDAGFEFTRSLYFASKRSHVKAMRAEFDLRRKHGFPVHWLDAGGIREQFGIEAPAAILSDVAAQVDPYRLAYRTLMHLADQGAPVHDRCVLTQLQADARGVTLTSERGFQVHARHMVVAAGYETQNFIKQRVAKNRSSYAWISEPVQGGVPHALSQAMVWESARPYLYARATSDGRVLIGGEDDAVDIPAKRDARLPKKAQTLHQKAARLFPEAALKPSFAWAGTFAETEDGLPFFGPHPEHPPSVLFAMAYGGNGITYSTIGARLLRATIEGRTHPLAGLFSFDRLNR